MPASVSSSTVPPSAQRGDQPGQPGLLHRLVEADHPAGEGDPEVGGEPVQPAGVLDREHVGAWPAPRAAAGRRRRAGRAARRPAPAVRLMRRACHGRPATGPPAGPVREPTPVRPPPKQVRHLPWRPWRCWPPSGRSRLPRPGRAAERPAGAPRGARRRAGPPLPGDAGRAALSWLLTGAGTRSWSRRLWDISLPAPSRLRRGLLPARGAARCCARGYEYNRGYTFIVHPPLGKWLIAVGEQLFGYDSFGWRLPARGRRARSRVVVLTRLARRLTGSTLLGLRRRAAARPRRLLVRACRRIGAARRLPADVRGQRGSPAWSSTATGSAPGSATAPTVGPHGVPARAPRLADRRRRPVRLRLRGEVERRSGSWRSSPLLSLFWDRRRLAGGRGRRGRRRPPLRRGLPGAAWALGVAAGAHLPGRPSPAGSSARTRRAGTGPTAHRTPPVPFVPGRAALAVALARASG